MTESRKNTANPPLKSVSTGDSLIFLLHPDGQFIHQRDTFSDAAHDDRAAQCQQECRRIHGEGEGSGQYVPGPMEDGEQIGDRYRVGEVDEVGVLSAD